MKINTTDAGWHQPRGQQPRREALAGERTIDCEPANRTSGRDLKSVKQALLIADC